MGRRDIISKNKINTYEEQLADYDKIEKIREWLPHRSDLEIQAIMKNSYPGHTTWEDLQKYFGKLRNLEDDNDDRQGGGQNGNQGNEG